MNALPQLGLRVAGSIPLALVLGSLALPVVAGSGPDGRVPQPCLVPPHPQKEQGPPGLTHPLRLPRDARPGEHPVWGYHDHHLTPSAPGVLGTSQAQSWNVLALLVDFEDMEIGSELPPDKTVPEYFDRVLMFLGQIYNQMSDAQLTLSFDLNPQVYRLPETMAWYGLDDSIATREAELCRDAVEAADDDVDFSRYDVFMLFHAGAGQEGDIFNDSQEQIWSVFFRSIDFEFWLDAPDAERGIRTNDLDPGTQDPFYVDHMVVCPEFQSQDGFAFGILGVVAHEFGHRFGLPDLYDTTAPEGWVFAESQGIGTFGLMGAGLWNENGFYPAEMCAWSRFYVGWLRPRVVAPGTGNGERIEVLDAIQIDRRQGAVRIPLGGDEYFLIENRLRDYNQNGMFDFDDADSNGVFDFWTDSYGDTTEFDWFLPRELGNPEPPFDGSGFLIWHVDESILRDLLIYNLVNAEPLHKGVDLEEADGIQDLDKLVFTFEAFGDSRDSWWAPYATSFTPYTTPNTAGYHDARTGIWITDITDPGPTMSFRIRFSSPEGSQRGDFRAGFPRELPGKVRDFQPLTGDLDGDDRLEIVVCVVDSAGEGGVLIFRDDGTPYFAEPVPVGSLRSEPILVDFDLPRTGPELVWVTGDSVLVMNGSGVFLDPNGGPSASPVPFYRLARAPERTFLTSGDLDLDGQPEIVVGFPAAQPGWSEVLALSRGPGGSAQEKIRATHPGEASLPHALANVDDVDGGLVEMVSSLRTETGGHLAVSLYEWDERDQDGSFPTVRYLRYTGGDSVSFSAPVVGDLDRKEDGEEEIVVVDSEGRVHALNLRIRPGAGATKEWGAATRTPPSAFHDEIFEEIQGFPVTVGTLADDEVSLADVDGDGHLEILVFGPSNILHLINYNGTSVLRFPVGIPGEDRFTQAFLSPLVLDVGGDAGEEFLLPLPDGQVRAHDLLGRPLSEWAYLGGGNQRSYPVVADLEGDGELELVTVEDVTMDIPRGGTVTEGDESKLIEKQGRVVVRGVGAGSARGSWPMYRHDVTRTARAATPTGEGGEPASGLMADAFIMPNPVVALDNAGFHYRIRSDVQRITIEVFTSAGRRVTTLTGTVFEATDNVVQWDLANHRGNKIAPGLYYARFQAEAGSQVEIKVTPFAVVR